MSTTAALEPIKKTLVVDCDVERAFTLFTAELQTWWPFQSHSIGSDKIERVVWEGAPGGRVYERHTGGGEADWGRVLEWDPPHRLVMSWFPGQDQSEATELEVRFFAEGTGTRLELEHRAWEARGEKAAEARASYDKGWDDVLGYFPRG